MLLAGLYVVLTAFGAYGVLSMRKTSRLERKFDKLSAEHAKLCRALQE